MIKKGLICFAILCSLFLVGCKKKDASVNDSYEKPNYEMGGVDNDIIVDDTRKIYYEANYNIYTKDIEDLASKINSKVRILEGYTENSDTTYNQYTNGFSSAFFKYRIPSNKLNEFLDYLDSFEGITSSSLNSTDITKSYEETAARIETLTARRDSYNKLLTEKNLSISEIMAIETRIDDINSELLTLNNLKNKYDGLVEYSIVNISIRNVQTYEEKSWFDNYVEYLEDLVVIIFNVIMYTLPFTIIAIIVLTIIIVVKRKKRQKVNNIK